MRAGLGVLRWSPAAFWAATPRELAAALAAFPTGPAPLRGDDLARLMAEHPDGVLPDARDR